jgi:apolipoprotein D and lipocalin family protein
MRNRFAAVVLMWLCTAGASLAAGPTAPEPKKPINLERFMGRWYEILRTPNLAQRNCYAAFQTWSEVSPGKFSIAQVCHSDSAGGSEHKVQTGAKVLDAPANTKFEASFFGGLLHRDYWVLDHADDYSWMIASTSNGKYVAALSRKPGLPKREVDAMLARVTGMGLETSKLVSVGAAVD